MGNRSNRACHYKTKSPLLQRTIPYLSVYDGEVINVAGNPAGSFWGYKTKGVFAKTNRCRCAAGLRIQNIDGTFTYFGAGDMISIDPDGNKLINELDKQVIGNPNPDYYGNITSKNFTNALL